MGLSVYISLVFAGLAHLAPMSAPAAGTAGFAANNLSALSKGPTPTAIAQAGTAASSGSATNSQSKSSANSSSTNGSTSNSGAAASAASNGAASSTNAGAITNTGDAANAATSTGSAAAPLHPGIAPTPASGGLLHQTNPQGLLSHSQSQPHQAGIITRALGGVVSDAAHATMALVGTTILNQGIDLPPDDDSKPEWPFNEPHRKALYIVDWADGSTAKISRLPDGTLQILGGGKRYMLQPESEGSYAMYGDFGSMATITPRPGGGYTICKADGTVEQVLPREGGGFTVTGRSGVIATILPGVGGKKHVIRGSAFSSGFIQ